MRKFEATTLDFYDDQGLLLKDLISDPSDVPDFVKTAEAVDQRAHPELFALVLHEDGKLLKKFATADAGNTWLSTVYFHQTHESLPEEAQKVASVHLIQALQHFEIEPPEFLFEILGEEPEIPETNLVDVTAARPPMRKVASAPDMEEVTYAIERADGSKYYPLRDANSVKVAAEYFETNHKNFVPRERREYAVKVASVAARGRLPLPTSIQKYASQGYSANLEAHLTTRYLHLTDSNAAPEIRNRLIKLASIKSSVEPEDFAAALEMFDREAGLDALWDRDVADPWYSTFCLEKVAKGAVEAPVSFDLDDNISVTSQELQWLAERGKKQMVQNFGWEVANSYEKNPIQIFESMPLPQKRIIARMAMNYSPVAGQ